MEQSLIIEAGVTKRVLHAGRGNLPLFREGSKIYFHFLTKLQDEEGTVLDNSKASKKPMELVIGKKFKLEIWEKCLRSMRVDEVAEFKTTLKHCSTYPAVAKTLREYLSGNHKHQHQSSCCAGAMMQNAEGLGYDDLNALMKKPQPLTFVLELLSISQPEDYEKELWQLNEGEEEGTVLKLKEQGNLLFKNKNVKEASRKYGEALTILENCALREKPQSIEWEEIESKKIPLLLNFCQCHLLLENYRLVIEHATTVIEKEKDNVKALYRRGKAFGHVWEIDRAREDLTRVGMLDPTLRQLIQKDLELFEKLHKQKDREQQKLLAGKMF